MLCGVGIQTLALICITWRTNWGAEVKIIIVECWSIYAEALYNFGWKNQNIYINATRKMIRCINVPNLYPYAQFSP